MCGFIWARLPFNPTQEQIASASRFIENRGPSFSSCDISVEGDFFILNRHFLLDVSGTGARQPTFFPTKFGAKTSLLFNGEIYNYQKLWPGASSDTEALLPLFDKYHSNLWKLLNGEYAIVIHEIAKNYLHIAADQFLTKPIAYAFDPESGAFGVASYPSALNALGFKNAHYFRPNTYGFFDLDDPSSWENSANFSEGNDIYHYNLKQDHNDFQAWEDAFIEAVRLRAQHGNLPVFVPLSSGYDSGAICLALNLIGAPYTTITINSHENEEIINQRIVLNKSKSCLNAICMPPLEGQEIEKIKKDISNNCEPFQYVHADESLLTDGGAVGAYRVAEVAYGRENFVCLSGCGADEIISDYGFGGKKLYDHSEFGGLFPEELHGFFPWKKFYGDTMRSYLFKDEYIFGVYGIEGRYPFLDPAVVQSFLSLAPELKNSVYKSCISAFLKKYNYPIEVDAKRGFSPHAPAQVEPRIQNNKNIFYDIKKLLLSYFKKIS